MPPLPESLTRLLIVDRHVRRSGDDYTDAFLTLLPQGQAWPKRPGSTLYKTCDGLSQYWGFVDSRAADLLERESDPRITVELLPDWEKAWGLPDPCFPETISIAQRQAMLVLKMTMLGAQSRAWFQWVANWLGIDIGHIQEFAPYMTGVSECGDTRDQWGDSRWELGPPELRFYWTIHVGQPQLTWLRAGSGICGVDHHLEIGLPDDILCLFERWKPAHTQIVADFSGLADGGPFAGTP
jgi:uncharacterized protein YmfQ (DUF2313 family)